MKIFLLVVLKNMFPGAALGFEIDGAPSKIINEITKPTKKDVRDK